MEDNLNASGSDLDLEYKDVVKDPSDPEMQAIAATIPEKYKGKSVDDLVNMHVNIEKVLARQGNEVGQLRRLIDAQSNILARATVPTQAVPEKKAEPITAERVLSDPQSAINSAVEPQMQQHRAQVNNLERQVAEGRFAQANPSYKDDVNDPEFQSWVLASPTRAKLISALHNYNFEAGGELWDLWKEHRGAKIAAEDARKSRVQAVSGTMKAGTAEPSGKPTLSRAKLNELHVRAMNGDQAAKAKWEDPEFQRMRLEAYAEERVK